MASEEKILQVLEIFSAAFPNYNLSGQAVGIYVRLLADLPEEILGQAAVELLSRATFFPTIAELRAAAFELLEALQGLPDEFEAWGEVQAQIEKVGHAGSPSFSHPLVARVVGLLGWRHLCFSEDLVADRAHFFQAYRAALQAQRQRQRQPGEVRAFLAAARRELPAGSEEGKDVQ